MKTIFFDLETGGVEPHHPNIQIAAVVMDGDQEVDAYECKITFNVDNCSFEALEINSYDPALWQVLAKPEKFALEGFCELVRRHSWIPKTSKAGRPYMVGRLAGHNVAAFDFPRLLSATKNCGLFLAADFPPLDTYQLAAWYFSDKRDRPINLQLGTLCDWFGITQAHAHDALSDVRATAQLAAAIQQAPLPFSEGA